MSNVLLRRFSRFAGIGLLNTVVDFGIYAILVRPLGIVLAQIIATGVAMTVGFVLNARYAFSADQLTWQAAVKFFAVNAFNFWLLQPLVILGIAHVLHTFIDSDYAVELLGKLGSLVVSMTINFLVYDRYVWPRTPVSGQPQDQAHN